MEMASFSVVKVERDQAADNSVSAMITSKPVVQISLGAILRQPRTGWRKTTGPPPEVAGEKWKDADLGWTFRTLNFVLL
eukprot:g15948.t1